MQTSGNLQHHGTVQGQPDPATVALHAFDTASDERETRLPDITRAQHGRTLPQAGTGLARCLLGELLATAEAHIGSNRHTVAQALAEQLCFQIVAIAAVDMCQRAAVFVSGLGARHQPDTPVAGLDQRLQAPPGGLGIGLAGAPIAADFRGIDADQAHAAAIDQTQGIAIHHLAYCHLLRLLRQRAVRQGREMPDDAHKKSAHKGRLFLQQCETRGVRHAHDYFLVPNIPKRSANFCTRPPVSRTFCLPV
ncbi:hypothetical protein D3C81_1504280 [compost metagenome]